MSTTARRSPSRARRVSGGRGRTDARQTLSLDGIRWDRISRLGLLLALVLVLLFYIGPVTNYWESWHLSRETRADVQTLRADNARLRERARALDRPQRVELEARKLGMARPGERVYVVRGLPRDR